MTELTENQLKVIDSIKSGKNSIKDIVNETGLSKSQVTGTITSLLKKELISKEESGDYSLNDVENKKTHSDGVNENTVDQDPTDNTIAVLIPYLKSEAAGEELKYVLRALEANLKEQFRIVIIGDQEDWFSPEITFIPHEPHLIKEDCNCPAPTLLRNPQADVTHKIFTAIASGEIKGDFILTNDDIFILAATYMAEIEVLKAFGTLDKAGKTGGLYNQNSKRTALALEKNKLPINRYGTHTPVKLNADRIIEIIEKYNALEKGFLLTSLYFNELFPDARPIQVDGTINDQILSSVYRSNVDSNLMKNLIQTRKFLNCDAKGWLSVKPHLEVLFPNSSKYEL